MKPGDHPEFFRFPAPDGRSRESSIVLDGLGRFWHDGAPIDHPGMARAFARWIRLHPDDGRFILSNGYDWTYFTVEDVPFFVRTLRIVDGRALLTTNDGEEEPLDVASLREGRGGALYCRVHGQYEARFSAEAQTWLAPLLELDEEGRVVVRG